VTHSGCGIAVRYFPIADYMLLAQCVPYEDTAIAVAQGRGLSFSTESMNEAVLVAPVGLSATRFGPPVMEIRKIAPHASSPLPLAMSVTPAA
jgi:hypothetical protein